MRHSVNGDGGCCGRMASHRHAVAVAVMTVIRRGALIGGEFTTTNTVTRQLSAKVKESVIQEGGSTQFVETHRSQQERQTHFVFLHSMSQSRLKSGAPSSFPNVQKFLLLES